MGPAQATDRGGESESVLSEKAQARLSQRSGCQPGAEALGSRSCSGEDIHFPGTVVLPPPPTTARCPPAGRPSWRPYHHQQENSTELSLFLPPPCLSWALSWAERREVWVAKPRRGKFQVEGMCSDACDSGCLAGAATRGEGRGSGERRRGEGEEKGEGKPVL